MKWLINSAVLPAGEYGDYRYSPATRKDLAAFLVPGDVASRVGYQETADKIQAWTGCTVALSRDPSLLAPGDRAMVVRLRYRVDPTAKGAPTGADDEAWEIATLDRLS